MEALLRFRRSVDRAEATFLLRRGASRSPAERPCFVGGITFERRQTNQGRTEENLALAFTSAFMAPALGSRLVTSQTRDQYTRGQFAVRASTLRRSKKWVVFRCWVPTSRCRARLTLHSTPTRTRRALFGRHAAADDLRRIISGLAGCVRTAGANSILHSARMILSDVLTCTVPPCVSSLPY
jgi:hypothetical protein